MTCESLLNRLCDSPGVRDGRHSPDDPQEHGPQTVEDELRVGVTLVLQTELLPRTELGRARLGAAVVEKNAAMGKTLQDSMFISIHHSLCQTLPLLLHVYVLLP